MFGYQFIPKRLLIFVLSVPPNGTKLIFERSSLLSLLALLAFATSPSTEHENAGLGRRIP